MASSSVTTTKNAIIRDAEKRNALNLKAKNDARERKTKLIPFKTSDGKTIFYCKTKEQGEKRLAEYEKKQKIYIGL
jgi:hypothetical protein